jgi:hypothetical protein
MSIGRPIFDRYTRSSGVTHGSTPPGLDSKTARRGTTKVSTLTHPFGVPFLTVTLSGDGVTHGSTPPRTKDGN